VALVGYTNSGKSALMNRILALTEKEEKTVYSCEVQAAEKSVAYTLENAQKKAFPKLAKEIEEAVKKDLGSFFKL